MVGDHKNVITNCKFNVSGEMFASSDLDGIVKLWNPLPTPRFVKLLN